MGAEACRATRQSQTEISLGLACAPKNVVMICGPFIDLATSSILISFFKSKPYPDLISSVLTPWRKNSSTLVCEIFCKLDFEISRVF